MKISPKLLNCQKEINYLTMIYCLLLFYVLKALAKYMQKH